MDIFSVITLFGGLAFFLYGMNVMSDGLEKSSGGKLSSHLGKVTNNKLIAMLFGAGLTIAVQSSSAVTVMLVGLVNSGIMQLGQSVGVIMGSNIGTTVTAWILSLAGIESDNFFVSLLKPSNFSPIIAFIGILMVMISKKERVKEIGGICLGFAVLMFGMEMMSDSMAPLSEMQEFRDLMVMFNNPVLGLVIGIVLTAVIQSSSATVGILQALSLTGALSYSMAIPIIMGQNIGTCVTALISSIGVNKNAKRVAAIHVYFNLLGTAILLGVFYGANALFDLAFADDAIDPAGIAIVHSIFNLATTAILFPFTKQLEKLAVKTIRDKSEEEKQTFIDERLLLTPAIAVYECRNHAVDMAKLAVETIIHSIEIIDKYDEKSAIKTKENEQKLDEYEDKLGSFLVKVSGMDLSVEDSNTVAMLLHAIGDFERIGDHAVNIMKVAKEMNEKNIVFSENATAELNVVTSAIKEILDITVNAFADGNIEHALEVEPLEQVIDELLSKIKSNHINRLTGGNCTIELGFVLSDLLTNYERVSDHCSNIAVCLIELNRSEFNAHKYLNNYKLSGSEEFTEKFNKYNSKYVLS